MHNVELQLAHQRTGSLVDATLSSRVLLSKCSGVIACGLDADKDFAVLKREHVRRPRFSEKFPVQKRHPPIGDEPNEDLGQVAQVASFPLSQLQAALHGACCECLKLTNIDADFSLQIPYADAEKGTLDWETPVRAISFSAANMFLIVHAQILRAEDFARLFR